MDVHRFDGFVTATIADGGAGVLGIARSTEGRTLTFELEAERLADVMTFVLNASTGAAEQQARPASQPGDGSRQRLNVAATAVRVVPVEGNDALTMVFRVGLLDLAFQLPRDLARLVGSWLQEPTTTGPATGGPSST